MILAYIFIGLFLTAVIFSFFLYKKIKEKKTNITKLKNKLENMENVINEELININNKIGFYDGTYNLDNKKYSFRVYVTELERFSNGFSKFKFDNVDIMGGFSIGNYDIVIKYAKNDFIQIQTTTNITFLDRKVDITKLRKDKLEKILKD